MNSLLDRYIEALKPTSVIKVSNLDNDKVPDKLLKEISKLISNKYHLVTDEKNGVIYVGKGI
jgi:hypothetical protein